MFSGLPSISRFAVGDAGSFLDALRKGGLTGAAGLYDPSKGLVRTSIDNGLGLGVIGSLIGGGGRGRGRRKELDNNAWLNQTYENLLGRDVGEEGAAYWGGELDGGATRDSVRDNIMQSDEYRDYQDYGRGGRGGRGGIGLFGNLPISGLFGGAVGSGGQDRSDATSKLPIGMVGKFFCDERLKIDIAPLENTEVNDELAQMSFFVKSLRKNS